MTDSVDLSIDIDASPARVWTALTEPKLIKTYMMGAEVDTDWQVGHPITWSGNYQGNAYADKGEIKAFQPNRQLSLTHWSPMSKLPDTPANYHTLTYDLTPAGKGTTVKLTQRNLTGVSPEQSKKNWQPMLEGLKKVAEAGR